MNCRLPECQFQNYSYRPVILGMLCAICTWE